MIARALPWLFALMLAAVLAGLGPQLDGIDDHHAEFDQARDLQVALQQAAREKRFEQAAQQLCGPQAAWEQLHDGSVQCRTKYGKPTVKVTVSP